MNDYCGDPSPVRLDLINSKEERNIGDRTN